MKPHYLERLPSELVGLDRFGDPNFPGEITTSFWLREVSVGTELKILQENIPNVIPIEMCYLGWQESLDKLKRLVEPNIPG